MTAYAIVPSLAQRLQEETRTLYSLEKVTDLVPECEELAYTSEKHFQVGQYEAGITFAQREPTCQYNAIAQGQVGLGCAYMRQYDEARRYLQGAIALSRDPHVQAHYTAILATTFLEEWDLDAAEQQYHEVLRLRGEHVVGLLGCLAVACQREDVQGVERALQHLREQHPDWHTNERLVSTLVHDRVFRFLREHTNILTQKIDIPQGSEEARENESWPWAGLMERLAACCERQEQRVAALEETMLRNQQEVLTQLAQHLTTLNTELAAFRADITALRQEQQHLASTLAASTRKRSYPPLPPTPLVSWGELRERINEASRKEDEHSLREAWELLSLQKYYEGNPTGLRELAEYSHLSQERVEQWLRAAVMRSDGDYNKWVELIEVLHEVMEPTLR